MVSRHWAVFFSGTTTILIFWVITPLLGAVFAENYPVQTANSTAKTVAKLVSGTSNTIKLDGSIIADAYGVTWLGQRLPGFVTATGAIAPFELESTSPNGKSNESRMTTSDFYTTELNCTPAKIGWGRTPGHTFDNGQGCHTDAISPSDSSGYSALYIGYYDDPSVDWSLSYLGCPPSASHTFLAIWADVKDSMFNNVTALFCEPTYSVHRVNATVFGPHNNVTDVAPLGSPMALSQDQFNSSDFEYLIGAGIPALTSRADVPQTNTLDQWSRIKDMDVQWPVTNMVGFALGANQHPPYDYFNATILASEFQAAHQLLFALAAAKLFSSKLSDSNPRPALTKADVRAVVVVPELAVAVEITLGLVTIFILTLLLISSSRKSQLRKDPASLSDLMELARPPTSSTMDNPRKQKSAGQPERLRLKDGKLQAFDTNLDKNTGHFVAPSPRANARSKEQYARQARPFVMRLLLGPRS